MLKCKIGIKFLFRFIWEKSKFKKIIDINNKEVNINLYLKIFFNNVIS